jgi:hypothetical protein
MTTASFDIFIIEPDESPLWIEAVSTLAEAESRVQALATPPLTRYLIFDQKTGHRHTVDTATLDRV